MILARWEWSREEAGTKVPGCRARRFAAKKPYVPRWKRLPATNTLLRALPLLPSDSATSPFLRESSTRLQCRKKSNSQVVCSRCIDRQYLRSRLIDGLGDTDNDAAMTINAPRTFIQPSFSGASCALNSSGSCAELLAVAHLCPATRPDHRRSHAC